MLNKEQQINQLLTRGVDEIIDKKSLEEKLRSGKKLRVKLGIDPTSPNIHLGRSIPLLKLRDFQELGHQIVFIIGDFTGLIGDTSDKESERPMLEEETIQANLKNYISQAAKIIDVEKAEVHYNSTWLASLNYMEIGKQANIFSLNSFISRENISKRLKEGKRISLRELLYPLMQGYDSVKLESDVEIGGSDQRFNVLAGRDMQKAYNQEPQDIITNPLIMGLDGRKMSSSFGNTINLADSPNDMFGKTMSMRDDLIITYFTLLTRLDLELIKSYEKELKEGLNPRDLKMKLAFELVSMYHSEEDAKTASDYFVNTFSKKEAPSDPLAFSALDWNIISVLVDSALASSKSEARRLVEQGSVKVNGEVVKDFSFSLKENDVLQKGKIHFIKLV